ncbi:iron permease FTR1 family-domain-containing protein [Scheffersomyces xylosifermentans]|uniref:iron permease FTR1 family-domain-containing protein n=1 Tax=Scheffersomyces xylosifermentans TaxID=1304137 RepID=UPI00315DB9D4
MIEFADYFSIQIFFIILRETLETAIIISVLLSFINQRSHNHNTQPDAATSTSTQQECDSHLEKVQSKLRFQVWFGALLGLFICLVIGLIFITAFYFIGKDYWSYTERLWEGVFSLLSSLIITIMGIGLLRINKVMKVKWWVKLGDAYNSTDVHGEELQGEEEIAKLGDDSSQANTYGSSPTPEPQEEACLVAGSSSTLRKKAHKKQSFSKKYFLAILPLITTLREGLEAVVFIGGIGMSSPPTSIPISIICGVSFGSFIGYLLYKGGNKMSLQYFLICSTCFLYIVSAGLMSRGVWFLELEHYVRLCNGFDPSETGSGPGSYDISKSVWHVNCCNGLKDGWWMVFNAIFGWTNSATYGSVGTYIAYWLAVIVWLEFKLYEEREGVLPLIPVKWQIKRIRKKVKMYEKVHKHNSSSDGVVNPNDYDELRRSTSTDILERDAESRLLLS